MSVRIEVTFQKEKKIPEQFVQFITSLTYHILTYFDNFFFGFTCIEVP